MAAHSEFGDFIRQERLRAGFGLRQAARELGISPSYLSRVEAGEIKPPSGQVLHKLANLYETELPELLNRAKQREDEFMAADTDAAPFLRAFYRVAYDQTPEVQKKMLRAAVDALDVSQAEKDELLERICAALSRAKAQDLPRRAKDQDGLFAFDIAPRVLSRLQIRKLARDVLAKVFGSEIPLPIPIENVVELADPEIILIVHDELEGGRLRDGSPAVLGLSRWSVDGERRELVVHEELFDSSTDGARRRANFTLAHELFHCLEHLPLVKRRHAGVSMRRPGMTLMEMSAGRPWYMRQQGRRRLCTNEDWREWQANTFAAELLMPEGSVKAAVSELFGTTRLIAPTANVQAFADDMSRAIETDDLGQPTSLADRFDVNPQAMAIRLISLGLVQERAS